MNRRASAQMLAEQLHFIPQGHGKSGPNRDYVLAAIAELEALRYRKTEMHRLAERLRGANEPRAST